jgi:hypothetical protein
MYVRPFSSTHDIQVFLSRFRSAFASADTNNPMAHLESIMGHGSGAINPFAQMPGMSDRNLNDPEAINSLLQDPEVISRTMSMMSPEMIDAVCRTGVPLCGALI